MTVLDASVRAALFVVFAVAFASKVHSRAAISGFVSQLAMLVPRRTAASATALGLAAGELCSVVLLVARPAVGYVVCISLLIPLTIGVAVAVRRRLRMRCSCFSASGSTLGPSHIARNLTLLAIAALGFSDNLLAGPEASAGVVITAMAGGAVGGALLTRWEHITALFAPAAIKP